MSEFLQAAGGIAACGSAAVVLLARDPRVRGTAMAVALVAALALIAGLAWDGELAALRHDEAKLAAVLLAGAAGIALLAAAFARWKEALPLALLAALPFRVPVDAGGESSNLLLPLYAVIAGGVALALWRLARGEASRRPESPAPARWLAIALGAAILLYAVQAAYSPDLDRASQNIAFFFVPFAIAFAMLRDADWSPRLLALALGVLVAEGVVFAAIGIGQEATRHIFWNEKAMESNEFDLQFRVNSLFWDPNIYGRYLALTLVVLTAALAWVRDAKRFAAGAAAAAVIFAGLYFSYSQTSTLALIAGLIVLCALRWSLRWTAYVCAAGAVLAVAALLIAGGGGSDEEGGSGFDESSGRTELTSGGLDLARERPLQGFGSGSFAVEFAERHEVAEGQAAVSHTEPITVAAEQGAIGIAVYLALLASIAALFLTGVRRVAPGLGAGEETAPEGIARMALIAAFAGLLLHTIGYAGFLTDPLSWALLALASSLSARS